MEQSQSSSRRLWYEAVVIVGSILLAVSIDRGYEGYQERAEEDAILSSLRIELAATQEELRRHLDCYDRWETSIGEIRAQLNEESNGAGFASSEIVLGLRILYSSPTFDPSTETATHNVPDQCGGTPEDPETPVEVNLVCRASGLSRTYELWYECGLGEYSEHNDIVTGSEDYTIDGQTYHMFTNSSPFDRKVGEGGAIDGGRTHTVTNWRQE